MKFSLLNYFKDSFGERRTCADARDSLTAEILARSKLDESSARELAKSVVESFTKMRDACAWTIGTNPPAPGQDPARWLESELQRFATNLRDVCTREMMKNFWLALEASEVAMLDRE